MDTLKGLNLVGHEEDKFYNVHDVETAPALGMVGKTSVKNKVFSGGAELYSFTSEPKQNAQEQEIIKAIHGPGFSHDQFNNVNPKPTGRVRYSSCRTLDNPAKGKSAKVSKPLTKAFGDEDGPQISKGSVRQTDVFKESLKQARCLCNGSKSVKMGDSKDIEELVGKDFHCVRCPTGILINRNLTPSNGKYKAGKQYELTRRMGHGATGQVWSGKDLRTGTGFAKKTMSTEKFQRNEVVVPSKLSHINVAMIFGIIFSKKNVDLFMENCGVSLNEFVRKRTVPLMEPSIWLLAKQGFEGLAYLHLHGVTHLDIKPENLCVSQISDDYYLMKITDFGSCKTAQEPMTFEGMTPSYLAPEIAKELLMLKYFLGHEPVQQVRTLLLRHGISTDVRGRADVFAMGLVVIFMYTGDHVLNNIEKVELIKQLATKSSELIRMIQAKIPNECCNEMKAILKRTLQSDPKERISARDAVRQMEANIQMTIPKGMYCTKRRISTEGKETSHSHEVCPPERGKRQCTVGIQRSAVVVSSGKVLDDPAIQTNQPIEQASRRFGKTKAIPEDLTKPEQTMPPPQNSYIVKPKKIPQPMLGAPPMPQEQAPNAGTNLTKRSSTVSELRERQSGSGNLPNLSMLFDN